MRDEDSELDTLLFIVARLEKYAGEADRLSLLTDEALKHAQETEGVTSLLDQAAWAIRSRAFESSIEIVKDCVDKNALIDRLVKDIDL